jgi:2Fe-2S ferredoxin
MHIITFIEQSGIQHQVEAPPGESAMRVALNKGVAGIDGDCGGVCACATCHVYVDEQWSEKVGGPSEQEGEILGSSPVLTDRSRLACQIRMRPDLDGLVLRVADNFR